MPVPVDRSATAQAARRALIWSLSFAVLGAAVVASALGTRRCARAPEETLALPAASDGVKLSRLAQGEPARGPAVQGRERDYLLETDVLRLIVGANEPGVDRQLRHGVVIDATPKHFAEDHLLSLATVVEVGGVDEPLGVVRVTPTSTDGRPSLTLHHSSASGRLQLRTLLALTRGRRLVELTTRAKNASATTMRNVAIGDVVSWPGAPSFAPRLGFVEAPTRARVPWFARRGKNHSSAMAYPDGADVEFRFDLIGPTEQRALTRPVNLDPGGEHVVTRRLIVTPGGLAAVARSAWPASGKSVRDVRGRLEPAPAWATVEAQHPDGRPVLNVRADAEGRWVAALPDGEYRLLLRAPGGEDVAALRLVPGVAPPVVRLIPPEAGTLRFTVVDGKKQPLAARWMLTGVSGTKTPQFGPAERAAGAGRAGYTHDGEGRIQLPPGSYRIRFTHGPEFALWESPVKVGVQRGETLRVELPRAIDTPGWVGADFHLHAAPSHDSSISLEDRVTALLAEGVEFAVPTDHNHVTDYAPAVEAIDAGTRLATTPGVEITTTAWGHFNAYPYAPDAGLTAYGDLPPGGLFARVRELSPGAVIQVNHPRMSDIGYFNRGGLDRASLDAGSDMSWDFDVIEVLNGFELGQPGVIEQNLTEWMALLDAGRRFVAVGNSDSHRLSREFAGYPRTYVRLQSDDPAQVTADAVIAALRAGRAFVTNGPFVDARVEGVEPGDTAVAEDGKVTVSVVVRAPAWIDVARAEVWMNGVRVAITTVGKPPAQQPRLQWQTEVPVERDSWIVVIVRGDRELDPVLPGVGARPLAFTNPIWVDADGDGSIDGGADAGAGPPD